MLRRELYKATIVPRQQTEFQDESFDVTLTEERNGFAIFHSAQDFEGPVELFEFIRYRNQAIERAVDVVRAFRAYRELKVEQAVVAAQQTGRVCENCRKTISEACVQDRHFLVPFQIPDRIWIDAHLNRTKGE